MRPRALTKLQRKWPMCWLRLFRWGTGTRRMEDSSIGLTAMERRTITYIFLANELPVTFGYATAEQAAAGDAP